MCSGPANPPAQQLYGMGGPAESVATVPATAAPDTVSAPPSGDAPAETEVTLTIGRNQTFYEALRASGAPHEDIMALVEACKPYRNLRRVRRGDDFSLRLAADGGIRNLSFDLDEESYLVFAREGDGYTVIERTHPVQHRISAVSGAIRSSLYASLKTAAAPLSLTPKMNDILGWEVDFTRDVRRGDTYRILYEEIWKDGVFVRTGTILALEYVGRGKTHQAFRFEDSEGRPGYYDADGRNLQKQLMRAPVEYSRISSGFSWRRFHPILKKYMPHLGVDYAAPVGTPIRAAGSGTILEATRKRGNGRYVKIQHVNRSYETFYLHLSRFASGIRKGVKVNQGQVIGYVGATGYATGPHVDFRVKKDGRFVNPRTLTLPPAEPVPVSERAAFATLSQLYGETLAALAPESPPHEVVMMHATRPPLWDPAAATVPLAATPTR